MLGDPSNDLVHGMIFSLLHVLWKEHYLRQLLGYIGIVQGRVICTNVSSVGMLITFPAMGNIDVGP